ncbi:MAG: LCP family protein [Bacteroidota bacterium]
MILAGLIVWQAALRLRPPQPALAEARLDGVTNILLLGTDARIKVVNGVLEEPRTDVMMLASCDPARNAVTILSIPRDTLVEMPGKGRERINMAHVYGGLPLTRLMVERLTGLRVDKYLAVDFRAFEELVDLMGGIEVEVDKRMFYEDKAQGLHIDLQKGRQVLNGRQALGFVRYRRDAMGDLSRVGRQQKLLRAILAKAIEEHLWTKFIALYRLKQRYVRTDLNLIDLYRLRNFIRGFASQANLRTFTVPGWFSGPFWDPDEKALHGLVEKEFTPVVREPEPMKEAH